MLNSICSAFVYASLLSYKLKAFAEREIMFVLIKWKLMKKSFKHIIETVFAKLSYLLVLLKENVGFIRKLPSALKFWFEYNSWFISSVELICFLVFCLFYFFGILVNIFPLEKSDTACGQLDFASGEINQIAWKFQFLLHHWLSVFRRRSNSNLSVVAATLACVTEQWFHTPI